MGPAETLTLPLGDGWVLCRPEMDRLVVLNATAKTVWDLVGVGFGQHEIASAFAQHFGVPAETALSHIREVIGGLEEAGFLARPPGEAGTEGCAPPAPANGPAIQSGQNVHCGTFQFGDRRVQVHSSLPDLGCAYFSRFGHRALDNAAVADVLEFSGGPCGYRLTFSGTVAAEANSLAAVVGRAHKFFLSWEHPNTEFLAYFHAAAVSRGGRSVLLPGVSGTGKSTLTGYLVSHGFGYLGDDLVALDRAGWSLRPLPTCLTLKSGSWPILTALYPQLSDLPTFQWRGRDVRHVELGQAQYAGSAPSVILFPAYAERGDTYLKALAPLQTMTRLLETTADLHRPITEATLVEFLQFVEQTPAYELVYKDLPSAKAVIGAWLDRTA